ncbi:LVIVD repeat-containing protein [Candidatus Palauibacter sp.]|uniref:LVIVD repeat-containing protein n=1 Tax=Candidatus Palauibacter sp. TaxID=3101350 RepID=UPI003C6F31B1
MKFGNRTFSLVAVIALGAGLTAPGALRAQVIDGVVERGSRNMEVLGHVPLGPRLSIADMDMEQEMHRPYAYVARMQYGPVGPKGLDIVSIADPEKPEVLYEWRIEDQDLHQRTGGMDVKHFKWGDRYYVVQSLQFGQGGPDSDMGAVVLDVTGLPDASTVREVARIKEPDLPGGFHNIFIYKHSNMNVYLVATVSGPYAAVYDLGALVEGRGEEMVAQIPLPDQGTPNQRRGYHDFYLGYHPDTGTDRFYGGGFGGYYIYDVSDLQNPELLTQIVQVSGIRSGHTFTPTPDGNFAIAETEYQYAPLRIFDLRPGLSGEVPAIRSPIAAWTANWKNLVHNHEVRWPLVFVSGYLDGLVVFNMMDPTNPMTVAHYDTYLGPPNADRTPVFNGTFGVDIRNEDGLIVVSDMTTGFWTFRMEGFQGWNGEDWGMPNISSAQDWDNGPAGASARSTTDQQGG